MSTKAYTTYWVNRRDDVRKEHGTYASEEEAVKGIEAWWEIHQEKPHHVEKVRTNTGALEIYYGEDYYYYRIEERRLDGKLPAAHAKKRSQAEVESLRKKYDVSEELYLYEELAEPYQDRLTLAMNDGKKILNLLYDHRGRPVRPLLLRG